MSSFARLPKGLLLAALSAIGFLRAHTAYADCPSPVSCVCDSQFRAGSEANPPSGALVRVRATAVAEGFLQAELLEVVGPSNGFQLQPGDVLGRLGITSSGAGAVITGTPCSHDRSGIVVGAELLAYYHPSQPGRAGGYSNCEQFRSCAAPSCDPIETRATCEQACAAQTEAICREQALLDGYFSWVVTWGTELDFGAGQRLASSNIAVLFAAESCHAAFPAPRLKACNDTSGCALAASTGSSGGAASGLLWLALCAGSWRLRRLRVGATPHPATLSARCRPKRTPALLPGQRRRGARVVPRALLVTDL